MPVRLFGRTDLTRSDLPERGTRCSLAEKQDIISLLSRTLSTLTNQYRRKSRTAGLPGDMIVEVMSRCTSLEALGTFRVCCKSLNKLAYDTKFIAKLPIFSGFIQHKSARHNAILVSASYLESESHAFPSINMSFLPEPIYSIEACSDTTGFILCRTIFNKCYICKPMTKEWLQVPNPDNARSECKHGLYVMKLYPFHFKILRLTLVDRWSRQCHYICELYDSKFPDEWRKLENVAMVQDMFLHGLPVTVNGYTHFLTSKNQMFAFDTFKHKWITFSLPQASIKRRRTERLLMKYKGELSLLLEEKFDIQSFWVMEDFSNKVWTKKSHHKLIFEKNKLMAMKCLHSYAIDPDLEAHIMLWNKLRGSGDTDGPLYMQSDFQKSKWTVDARRVEEAARSMNDDSIREMQRMALKFRMIRFVLMFLGLLILGLSGCVIYAHYFGHGFRVSLCLPPKLVDFCVFVTVFGPTRV